MWTVHWHDLTADEYQVLLTTDNGVEIHFNKNNTCHMPVQM